MAYVFERKAKDNGKAYFDFVFLAGSLEKKPNDRCWAHVVHIEPCGTQCVAVATNGRRMSVVPGIILDKCGDYTIKVTKDKVELVPVNIDQYASWQALITQKQVMLGIKKNPGCYVKLTDGLYIEQGQLHNALYPLYRAGVFISNEDLGRLDGGDKINTTWDVWQYDSYAACVRMKDESERAYQNRRKGEYAHRKGSRVVFENRGYGVTRIALIMPYNPSFAGTEIRHPFDVEEA
jgi:hypothetical protein